jgi:NADH:ubiquinone oxidoreductase subunit E
MRAVRDKIGEILKSYADPKSDIVSVLEEVQRVFGCLPEDALKEVANQTELALVRIMRAVDCHDSLVLEKDLKKAVEICICPNCILNGGREILKGLREILLVKSCGNGIGARYCISTSVAPESPCVRPPTVIVEGQKYQNVTLSKLTDILEAFIAESAECSLRQRPRAASL